MIETYDRCLFCSVPAGCIISEDTLTLVIRDGYPVSPSHSLIIPKRHIVSFFDLKDKLACLVI